MALGKKIELDSSLMLEITRVSAECSSLIPAIVLKTKLDYIISGLQENLSTRRFVICRERSRHFGTTARF